MQLLTSGCRLQIGHSTGGDAIGTNNLLQLLGETSFAGCAMPVDMRFESSPGASKHTHMFSTTFSNMYQPERLAWQVLETICFDTIQPSIRASSTIECLGCRRSRGWSTMPKFGAIKDHDTT